MGVFRFKNFSVDDNGCGMKICSDSVLLAAWFFEPYRTARRIADIGAGSGVLALLAADICAGAAVEAVELDSAAADAARKNFASSPFSSRLELTHCDFSDWNPSGRFGLIISNPPYFTTGERSADAARSAARHQEGLSYASLLARCPALLEPRGRIGIVSPAELENDIVFSAELAGMKLRRMLRVRTSPRKEFTRLLCDFSTDDGPATIGDLSLRNADGSYSDEYRRLVEPYYLKL